MTYKSSLNKSPENRLSQFSVAVIAFISVALPGVVTFLFFMEKVEAGKFTFLPAVYATINAITSICLIAAYAAIRKRNITTHRLLMTISIFLSALFLVLYVIYHATTPSTSFGGTGSIRYVYYFILITHIFLSAAVVPLVLISYVQALAKRFDKHRRIARVTLPIWLYVTISGVLVYLLISPYYT